MTQPTSLEEFNAKAGRNSAVDGFGADTHSIIPCPGCAEPGWKKIYVFRAQDDSMKEEPPCTHCGRSFKVIFNDSQPGVLGFELVQTGGDDLPDWYQPKMRRI